MYAIRVASQWLHPFQNVVSMNDASSKIEANAANTAAAQRLHASEEFLDRVGRIAAVGGWAVDLRSQVVTWSRQTRRMHEVDEAYVPTVAQGISFYAPEARPVIEAAVATGIRDGVPWDLELPFITATGRPLWVRTFGEVDFEDGQPVRLIGAFQDITERRDRQIALEREQDLRAQSERHAQELDRLLRERSEMLDVLAHEVRQPLNNASAALQGAATALGDVDQKVAALRLKRAQTVMSHVLASIDNTLAAASLLASLEPLQHEDTDIDALLAVVIADMPESERCRVRIERLTPTRTASMEMNLMRLALRNLLANALKYSGDAAVHIRLTDSDDPLAFVFEVSDGGQGIAAELVPHLFERSVRAAKAGRALGHGLGLGLYIVRRVMELHGGRAELAANSAAGVTMRLVVHQA